MNFQTVAVGLSIVDISSFTYGYIEQLVKNVEYLLKQLKHYSYFGILGSYGGCRSGISNTWHACQLVAQGDIFLGTPGGMRKFV